MKAILQSIKPQHCANIAAGKKTIEVRKTKPSISTPFKVYIYCTKPKERFSIGKHIFAFADNLYFANNIIKYGDGFEDVSTDIVNLNGKIIGEYVCDSITTDFLISDTCVSVEDLEKYSGNKAIYGWHISNLVIYDKPKELYDFIKPCTDQYQYCQGCEHGHIIYPSDVETYEDLSGCCFDTVCLNRIRKAPQSWCYIEEVQQCQ